MTHPILLPLYRITVLSAILYDIIMIGDVMEYLQVFDQKGNALNESVVRNKKMNLPNGKYFKTVIVYIQNSKGEILIQKTSKQKGSEWATTGGHVPFAVSSLDTMHNEILEELGIDIEKEKLEYIWTEKDSDALQDDYFLQMDIDIDKLSLQKEEVEFVKWITVSEIEKMIQENNFREGNIPFFEYLIKIGRI